MDKNPEVSAWLRSTRAKWKNMSFHNRTLTFMTPKKRILEHVLKLDENILQAEEKCSTFLTLQLLPACMSAEKTVHVQACVLNCLLCLSVLCGSLFGFFVFYRRTVFYSL